MAQRKFVKYRKNTIVYAKGMTKKDIIDVIKKRMEKRETELQKRHWIVIEYKAIEAKQKNDQEWLNWVERHWDEKVEYEDKKPNVPQENNQEDKPNET